MDTTYAMIFSNPQEYGLEPRRVHYVEILRELFPDQVQEIVTAVNEERAANALGRLIYAVEVGTSAIPCPAGIMEFLTCLRM